MIPNLTAVIIIFSAISTLTLITFLPAFIELKKPKDGGPRRIIAGVSEVNLRVAHVLPIVNIEDEQKFDSSLVQTMAKAISFLPSLEI
jgi:hypothetical protein